MLVLTAENMKKAEASANEKGQSFHEMMERAGTRCAEAIAQEDKTKKTVILCGKGKNGGDGLVIARKLWEMGFRSVFLLLLHGEVTDSLCCEMFSEMRRYPVDVVDMTSNPNGVLHHIRTADILVDSIFGIGFRGELSGQTADAVRAANANHTAVKYAIDIPSGLSADGDYHGQLYCETDKTLSMIALKPVHVLQPTAALCGETSVMDIGVETSDVQPFAESYTSLTQEEAFAAIHKRPYDAHKGTYGKVLTVCGSRTMTGCVYLCNQAAVEIGAGLVTAAFPESIVYAVAPKLNEPLMLPVSENANGRMCLDDSITEKIKDATVIAVGCGIGVDGDTRNLVKFIIQNADCPVVLDADALNCVAEETAVLKEKKSELILTPHPGEMARLTGKTTAEIQANRIAVAAGFAKEYGVTLLLKGANTVIANPDRRLCLNATGNPGMARGGSGDVLTGLLAGLIPQTDDLFTAAIAAAYWHGKTADRIAERYGILAPTPTRVLQHLHETVLCP